MPYNFQQSVATLNMSKRKTLADFPLFTATTRVVRAWHDGHLQKADLKTYLYGFQIAQSLLPKIHRRKRRLRGDENAPSHL